MNDMLAHQGGWDEAALIAAPILLLVGLLYLAGRRARSAGILDEDPARSLDDREEAE